MNAPALLDVDQVAERLRCSRRRVFELLAEGTLTRGPRFGRCTVVTLESVEAALSAPAAPVEQPAQPPRARRGLAGDVDALIASRRAARRR